MVKRFQRTVTKHTIHINNETYLDKMVFGLQLSSHGYPSNNRVLRGMMLKPKEMMPINFLPSHPYNLPSRMGNDRSRRSSIPFHHIFTIKWTILFLSLNLHKLLSVSTCPSQSIIPNNILYSSHMVEPRVIDHLLAILICKSSKGCHLSYQKLILLSSPTNSIKHLALSLN